MIIGEIGNDSWQSPLDQAIQDSLDIIGRYIGLVEEAGQKVTRQLVRRLIEDELLAEFVACIEFDDDILQLHSVVAETFHVEFISVRIGVAVQNIPVQEPGQFLRGIVIHHGFSATTGGYHVQAIIINLS